MAALAEVQQQLKGSEQDRATLTMNLDKANQVQTELNSKLQNLLADLQKAQQEKEAHKKEIASLQENLGKTKKALKESQNVLDAERKTHKSAVEERVCWEAGVRPNQFSVFLQLWKKRWWKPMQQRKCISNPLCQITGKVQRESQTGASKEERGPDQDSEWL